MKKNIYWFILGLLILIPFRPVFAQLSFPAGGSSLDTAVEIAPGQYQGGQLDWEEGGKTQQAYYLNNVKSGQAIVGGVRFSGNTNVDFVLYDSNKNDLTHVYGGENDMETLTWLTSTPGTFYLLLKNDAINQATNLSLDLKLVDYFDAGSQTDAGKTVDQALPIVVGTYDGYLSGDQGNDTDDYYKLVLKKGDRASVKISPPGQGGLDVALYDVNRTKLDEQQAANPGAITTLSFVPANDGNYYLDVKCSFGCEKIIAYKMEVGGAALPTGGGLMVTEAPGVGQPTTAPESVVSPSTAPLTANSLMANERDQTFLLIIIGTVLAVIIAVVFLLRRKPPEKDGPPMNSGSPAADKSTVGYKHPCVYCDKLIPPNSRSCPFCGKANPQGPIRCPKCNTPIEKGWKVCDQCNFPLSVKCPHCGKTTFFGDYCEHCDKRLLVKCPNCKTEQPPIGDTCKKCKKPLLINKK